MEAQTKKLSMMRRTIAKRMKQSWETSPRVTYHMDLDAGAMQEYRTHAKATLGDAVKITYNHIIMKAVAMVLMEMPHINASITEKELIMHASANIGLAVAVKGGLLVPNIKQCESKSIHQLAEEAQQKIEQALAGKPLPEDLSGATFTITNLGMYGVKAFSPIINQPEVAILGVCAINQTPVAVDGQVVIRPIMGLSLTADHRAVDGAETAKFLQRLCEILGDPMGYEQLEL